MTATITYDLDMIDHAARQACLMSKFMSWGSDMWDRYETARAAIVEHLYTNDDDSTTLHDLAVIGMRTISRAMYDESANAGYDYTRQRVRPTFEKFWWWHNTPHSPEDGIVERHALRQIFDQLGPLQQRTLVAVAAHPTYADAATAEGCGYDTFLRRVKVAREAFYGLWHEGEKPSRLWARTRKADRRGEEPFYSAVQNVRRRNRGKISAVVR